MQKTYWWRIGLLLMSLTIVVWTLIYDIYICFPDGLGACPMLFYRNYFLDPVGFFSVAFAVVSLFLFFVSDIVFKKWLWFAALWILLSILIIVPAPMHSGGLITGFQFTKENGFVE